MPVQALGPALPTLTDHMNAVEDRDIRNTTAKQAIDVNDLKLEVERLNQLHQIASSATDQASYDRARATVGKLLGPDILADIPEQYDPAVIDQFKRELVPVKDQIEQAINKMKAENPFGNSLAGKLAAAEAKGDTASADLLRRSIGEAAQAGGIQQMVDFGGNTIDARRFPGQRTGGISGMMGGGQAAPARQPMPAPAPQVQPTQMPMPNDGTTFVNPPTNPKERQVKYETDEAIRKAGESERARLEAEATTKARIDLPKLRSSAQYMKKLLTGLKNSPGRSMATGFSSVFPIIPGTDAKDFMARWEQVGGKNFLEAFESLKGGGSITVIEGEKATNAIARMDRAQSEQEFVNALDELMEVVDGGFSRAEANARGDRFKNPGLSDVIPLSSPTSSSGAADYREFFK